ncbi:MAG: thiamine diphosphokinase [Roseinatronobacter sp.]
MGTVVNASQAVTLVGGGEVLVGDLTHALRLAPKLVAADGGGNILADMGLTPDAVIGDMDSLRADLRALWADRVHPVPEQDSTDFDKCLRLIRAPLVLALGFTGARMDHTLSAMSALVRHGRCRVILVGPQDVCCLCPPEIAFQVASGARVSLYPMGRVTGRSQGLHWPIDGIAFSPAGVIGTSNRADAGAVRVQMDRPEMLLMLERDRLDALAALLPTVPDWPL